MASIAVALTTFAVILLAELPDKTALASLVLGTRYRSLPVLMGIGAAFTLHAALAVAAGSLLGLLPHRILEVVVALLFIAGALVLFFGRRPAREEKQPPVRVGGFWVAAVTGFMVILVAEFGDLTQVVIANLVARFHDPLAVGVAAAAAMWTVAAAAVLGGRGLLRLVPLSLVTRTAAVLMVILAGFSLAGAFG